jgi:hypothetical protein
MVLDAFDDKMINERLWGIPLASWINHKIDAWIYVTVRSNVVFNS